MVYMNRKEEVQHTRFFHLGSEISENARSKLPTTVNQLFFIAIFSRFYLHGYFRGDLYSRTAELDYVRTMFNMSSWTVFLQFIFANLSFS